MQNLIVIITIVLIGAFLPSNAQSKYETEMTKALNLFSKAETVDEMEKAAKHFDRIAKVEKEDWLPQYYSILIRALNAFSFDNEKAIKQSNELEKQYSKLESMNGADKSEILVLRGIFRTVKVAKKPMEYGMSLSGAIIKDYDDALKLNPDNSRAMYLLAQFNMEGAPYWGKNPTDYCPQIEIAKQLFSVENKKGFEPKWGEEQVDEILSSTCKK